MTATELRSLAQPDFNQNWVSVGEHETMGMLYTVGSSEQSIVWKTERVGALKLEHEYISAVEAPVGMQAFVSFAVTAALLFFSHVDVKYNAGII